MENQPLLVHDGGRSNDQQHEHTDAASKETYLEFKIIRIILQWWKWKHLKKNEDRNCNGDLYTEGWVTDIAKRGHLQPGHTTEWWNISRKDKKWLIKSFWESKWLTKARRNIMSRKTLPLPFSCCRPQAHWWRGSPPRQQIVLTCAIWFCSQSQEDSCISPEPASCQSLGISSVQRLTKSQLATGHHPGYFQEIVVW